VQTDVYCYATELRPMTWWEARRGLKPLAEKSPGFYHRFKCGVCGAWHIDHT
jgi:hypothetical protein